MPPFLATPFGTRSALLPGIPSYSYGSFNDHDPGTRMQVTSVAITSNVATIGVQILEGFLPVVGQLVSIQGTRTANSGGAPNFNVSNAAITGVTIDKITGIGTIAFALSASDVATTPDSGEALCTPVEVGEAITSDVAGLQFAMQPAAGLPNNSRDIAYTIETPSAPDSFSFSLQVADVDQDAQYTSIDTQTAAGHYIVNGIRANFVRGIFTDVTGGTDPTGVVKILV